MDTVTLVFAGATTRGWTPTADVRLMAVESFGPAAVVSWNPNVISTDFTAPAADSIDTNVIAFLVSTGILIALPDPVPISAGRSIFVAVNTKGAIALFYLPS